MPPQPTSAGSIHELHPATSSAVPASRVEPAASSCREKWTSRSGTGRSVSTVASECQLPEPPPPPPPRSGTPEGGASDGSRSAPSGRPCMRISGTWRAISQSSRRRRSDTLVPPSSPATIRIGPLCLISVLLVHAGKSAWHEPAMHAAEPGEHSPAALFQRGFVSIEGRLGVALGGVNRLDLNRAPAARVKGAAEQLGTGREWDGAPLSRQASQQELDRGASLWMRMRHELFGQRLQFLGIVHRGQLTLGFVAS